MTDGRLLPFGLVLAALLVAGAAVAVLIDVRRGRRARTHAAPRGRRRAVAPASEAAQQVSALQVSAQQVSAEPVPAQPFSAPPFSAQQAFAQVPPPQVPESGVLDSAEYVERQLLVDRELSSVDLSFPFTASLADSLHDELFTHRAVRS